MKSKTIFMELAILMAVASLLLAASQSNKKLNKNEVNAMPYEQITQEEAKKIMDSEEEFLILDVRTPGEFSSGHIKGAMNIPNETISDEAPSELNDKSRLILVYCRSGRRSKEAAKKLAKLGYTNVKEFGGIIDWKWEIVKEKRQKDVLELQRN